MWRKFLAFGAFSAVLVAAGVVLVSAYVLSSHLPPMPGDVSLGTAQGNATSTSPAGPGILFVDARGARLVINGQTSTLRWPQDARALGESLTALRGYDLATGSETRLGDGFVLVNQQSEMRSPDGKASVLRAQPKGDGTGVIEFHSASSSSLVPLRQANGKGIRNITILGWWDPSTVAVTGMVTSSRMLFAVSSSGRVRTVETLPDTFTHPAVSNTSVWYVTVTPGEGLESDDGPPSYLHRVSVDGKNEIVAQDPVRVMRSYAVSADHGIVYATSDGQMMAVVSKEKTLPLGTGTPLAILPDGAILFRRGAELLRRDRDGKDVTLATDLLDDTHLPAAVFFLSRASQS